jgi:hypothetical protein
MNGAREALKSVASETGRWREEDKKFGALANKGRYLPA